MKSGIVWKFLLILILVVTCLWLFTRNDSTSNTSELPTIGPGHTRTRISRHAPPEDRTKRDEAARQKIQADWINLVAWLESEPRPTTTAVRARLAKIRMEWTEMDLQVLASEIETLLAIGKDYPTGLDFQVGPHGLLKSWPTTRVFLLDLLATADPEMAARIARDVLDQTSSANEFAVALRSLTRDGPVRAPDAELLARFTTMLQRDDWHRAAGFAEACDLPRFVGSAEAARTLIKWDANPALRDMALAELAADHPAAVLDALADESQLNGITRANLMARANPADASQLAAVDAYLRNPQRTANETTAFLKAFPLRNATTGFRLYGKPPAPYDYQTIAAGDRAALELVQQWANDPALEAYREPLLSLQKRLEEWTSQTR